MSSIPEDTDRREVIIGVDTRKHIHVAVAIDQHGARLGDLAVSADTGGYTQLEQWARALGRVDRFGIEGTGSYGAGLTSFLRRCGHRIVEVNRRDRRSRRQNGKSDTLDAEAAARSVLARTSTNVPEIADGTSEMIRQIKIVRDTARKGRTTAIITLDKIVVNSPPELSESLTVMTDKQLLKRCSIYRPGIVTDTTASAKHALQALAMRWFELDDEIAKQDRLLGDMTAEASSTLRDGYGSGADTAAETLIVLGDIRLYAIERG